MRLPAFDTTELRLHKATLMVLLTTPAALFVPRALDAPLDAGLFAIMLPLALWQPQAFVRALRTGAFLILSGLALLALLASTRIDAASVVFVAKFTAGALTGIAVHFVYVEQTHTGVCPERHTAMFLAAYVAVLSFVALFAGNGHTQLALLSITLATLVLFYLLRTIARLFFLPVAILAFLFLNSKTLVLALLIGCVVLGNLRAQDNGLRFQWLRAAAFTLVLVPLALAALWFSNPARFDDLVNPSRSISTMARLDLATAGVAAFRDNPLLGLGGYGMNIDYNFHRYYEERNLAPLIEEGLTRSHGDVYGNGFTSGVHNMFLDYLTTYGGISFVIVAALLVRGMTMSMRHGYIVKIAAALTILVLGLGWQYTASAFGTALLIFACWPFRFTQRPALPVRASRSERAAIASIT